MNYFLNNGYIIEKKLGQGSFGCIYEIENLYDNNKYALKEIELKGQNHADQIENEAKILSKLNSEFIVKYYNSFWEGNKFYILMEFCNGKDLQKIIDDHIKEKRPIKKGFISNILLNISLGLQEAHNNNIIHRDLKPKNLFLTKESIVKIGDFGLAKQLYDINDYTNTYTGTQDYMAPEIKEKKKYNFKCDIWSLGCILYELCTLKKYTENSNKSINARYYGRKFQYLINILLNKNNNERPSIKDVIKILTSDNNNYNLNQNLSYEKEANQDCCDIFSFIIDWLCDKNKINEKKMSL